MRATSFPALPSPSLVELAAPPPPTRLVSARADVARERALTRVVPYGERAQRTPKVAKRFVG